MKSWQHIYYSASTAAEALLYLIFTLVWLLITYQDRVRTQRPNKTTHFTVKKLHVSHVTPLSPHTASDILVVLGRAASCPDNYEDKNTHVKTGLKIASRVCIICLREKEKNRQGEKWSTINCRRSGKLQFGNQAPYNLNIQLNTSVTTQALQKGSNTHLEDSSPRWIWSRIFGLLI